jgi:hypothetical protein
MRIMIISMAGLFIASAQLQANGSLLQSIRTRLAIRDDGPCGWDAQFRAGTATVPCGKTRGMVLYVCGHAPYAKARLQSGLWKGKVFEPCGTFINRWPLGIRAIRESYHIEPSVFDGQPCLVMQYPRGTPVFGGVRDEVRQIAPGTWLGRSIDIRTGELKNYFLLQSR